MIRTLPSGVYLLSTGVIVGPYQAEKDEYTIYDFDHDSDGKIDLKMMNDYVKEIPIPQNNYQWMVSPILRMRRLT